MSVLRIEIIVFVLVVTILRLLFALLQLRLGNYRLPFEIIYALAVWISAMRIEQYVHLYLSGDLPSEDFGISLLLEVGTYTLNMISLVTYAIKRDVDKVHFVAQIIIGRGDKPLVWSMFKDY